MQDGAVRHTNLANHRDMDDVSVLQDEDFKLKSGAKAPCPGMSGVAAEDCNCRCYIERELMTDDEYFAKTGKHFSNKSFTNDDEDDIIFNNATVEEFTEAVNAAKAAQVPEDAWRVTAMSADEFKTYHFGARCHITNGGSVAAVTTDGDIVSVCKMQTDKGISGKELIAQAVEAGGIKLDSYEGNHGFYMKCGFEPVSWCKWDNEFAPPGWIKGRDKPEDIIFYKYTGIKSNLSRAELKEHLHKFKATVTASTDYDAAQAFRDYVIG